MYRNASVLCHNACCVVHHTTCVICRTSKYARNAYAMNRKTCAIVHRSACPSIVNPTDIHLGPRISVKIPTPCIKTPARYVQIRRPGMSRRPRRRVPPPCYPQPPPLPSIARASPPCSPSSACGTGARPAASCSPSFFGRRFSSPLSVIPRQASAGIPSPL